MDTRNRKPAPYHRQDWRAKSHSNNSAHKYKREKILKLYQGLLPPSFNYLPEIQEIYLPQASPPLLSAVFPFSHQLSEELNSRKYLPREKKPEHVPEWFEDDSKNLQKPKSDQPEAKTLLKIEEKDLEEKFTKIDLKVEEKLKKETEENSDVPEWDEPDKEEFRFEKLKEVKEAAKPQAPVLDVTMLRYYYAIGNPFVQILIEFGVPCGEKHVTFYQNSKPFEKIWHYKDLEGRVHGPFSSLEMFLWTVRDCFPLDLEISIGWSMNFVPMNIFNSVFSVDSGYYQGHEGAFHLDIGYKKKSR